MSRQRIEEALHDASDTERVLIDAGALFSVEEVFTGCFEHQAAAIVADETTFDVAGEAVRDRLQAAGVELVDPFVFPAHPTLYADYANVKLLIEAFAKHDAVPVAIGSGTLNDLVKRAVHECERRYMVVATAASMDGYTAFGASITKDGFKQTMECSAPRALLADIDVLANAPARMTASGYGDLLAKIPAGADWIIADALDVDPINDRQWSLVQGPLRHATGHPSELQSGDRAAMDALIEGLVLSGLAMQAASSSRPASGAEHQFSHLWEMEGLGLHPEGDEPPLSHGFKVAIGTISISALYDRVLTLDLSTLDTAAVGRAWPSWEEVERQVRAAHSEPAVVGPALEKSREKYVDADALRRRLRLLRERWPNLRTRLAEQVLPAEEVRTQLQQAGCPTTPEEIGVDRERLKRTYRRAQMIRPRYTVLDLLVEARLLDDCVDELFAPGGFWNRGADS